MGEYNDWNQFDQVLNDNVIDIPVYLVYQS